MSRADSVRRLDLRMAMGVLVLAAIAVLAPHVRAGSSQPAPAERTGRIVRLDSRFDRLVPGGAGLENVAGRFAWVVGPIWDAARGNLRVSYTQKIAGARGMLHEQPDRRGQGSRRPDQTT